MKKREEISMTDDAPKAESVTRATSHLTIPGYVLDQESLEEIDGMCKELVAGDKTECTYEMRCATTTSVRQVFTFKALDTLLSRLETEAIRVDNLSLRYSSRGDVGINTVFASSGRIDTKAFSHSPELQFDLDRLTRQIRDCDQEYSWPVRSLVFYPAARRILRSAIAFLSMILLASSAYFFYARSVGVNVDPSLIPQGETLAKRAEEAIKSNDVNLKLNVLLTGNFKDFTNVSDILKTLGTMIAWGAISLAVVVVCAFGLKLFSRLYPTSYFKFGHQIKAWSKLERRREIWGIVVVIGFCVNVLAGVVVALVVR